MSKEIDNSLNLPPLDMSTEGELVVVQDNEPENDFQYARTNLYNVIEKGSQAIEDMIDLARASQHPRSYEVLSTLLKTVTDANKDLLDIRKKKKDLEDKPVSDPTTVNNNLFVGSTAELQKLLKSDNDK